MRRSCPGPNGKLDAWRRNDIKNRKPDGVRLADFAEFALNLLAPGDPPPLKWSDSKYGFLPEEDCDAEEETQAGRDCCQAAPG